MVTLFRRRAGFSRCKSYRYWLSREFTQGSGHCVFIGLNPSTGDTNNDDPTVRRCMGFACDWGYRHMTVVNLFAFRTPDPSMLKNASLPEGPGNRAAVRKACREADKVIAAWGTHGTYQNQSSKYARIWSQHTPHCFGHTKNHQPIHPLYQPKTASLQPYQPD